MTQAIWLLVTAAIIQWRQQCEDVLATCDPVRDWDIAKWAPDDIRAATSALKQLHVGWSDPWAAP